MSSEGGRRSLGRGRITALSLVSFVLALVVLVPSAHGSGPGLDPAKVVTVEACSECHVSAYEVWKNTPHATGFKTMHRLQNAEEIATRMGFSLIKRDSMCLDCHYTPVEKSGGERADSGVSCESCHGAGEGYLNVHNDYGGKGITHTTESAEHRRERIAASVAAGMRRPSDLYTVASNCYGCHMVPNEKLINVGRHSLGSSDFELASWSEEIRHNFLESFLDGDGTQNAERSVEHRRRLVAVGRMLALEHALRGLAEATEQGVYLKALQKRLRSAAEDVRQIAAAAGIEEGEQMVQVVRGVKARLGQRDAQLVAADRISELARAFLGRRDGTRLAALDVVLQGGELPPAPEEEPVEDPNNVVLAADSTAPPTAGGTVAPGAAPAGGSTTGSTGGTVVRPAVEAIPAEGDQRSHLRPRSSHDTLEASACQKCHGDQNAWWFNDRHFTSIDPFFDRDPKAVKIARLYGLSPSRMRRGDSLCMDCHGTVATARRSAAVEDGVSCQSCHGPAADYLEIHQEGDLSQGLQRPGFQKALQAGMKNLHDLETALTNCASCHYVTDPRLLSSGHPSGLDFDPVENLPKVKHWRAEIASASRLRSVWSGVLAQRGAVPKVRLARLAQAAVVEGGGGATGGASPVVASGDGVPEDRPSRITFRQRPAARSTPGATVRSGGEGSADLPEPPEIHDSTPIEDVLLLLERQLEELYRAVARPARRADSGERP